MCLALRASGLWLRYAVLQNLITSFPWIAPGWRAWGRNPRLRHAALQNLIPSFPWIAPPRPSLWRNPRKGRDQILPSGNLVARDFNEIAESERPYILFLAFCFTDRNELAAYMRELGVISVVSMKSDRGEITEGRWFQLDPEQEAIIRQAARYHKFQNLLDEEQTEVVEVLNLIREVDKDPVEVLHQGPDSIEKIISSRNSSMFQAKSQAKITLKVG